MKLENQFHSSGNGPVDTLPLAAAADSQVPQGPRSSVCSLLELPRLLSRGLAGGPGASPGKPRLAAWR